MTRKLRARTIVPALVGTAAMAAATVGGIAGGMAGAAPKAHAAQTSKSEGRHASLSVQPPAGGTISEAGSSLLYPLWNLWAAGYETTYPSVTVQTAAGGSGKGISYAIAGTIQIGASDAYLSSSEKAEDKTLENIPLAISAQEIFYHLTGVTSHLRLNGRVLAEIYEGKVKKWNTVAIASLNRGVKLPDIPIVALHRSDGSGDTFLFTTYLSDTTKGWASTVGYNTSVTWPKGADQLGETGNSGMVAGCKTTPGCIAYIGISYQTEALGAGLTYARVQNATNQYVMPTQKTIANEAAAFATTTPKTGAKSMIDGKVHTGYPIINYEYAIVSKKQSSASVAKNVRSVLEWAIDPTDGNTASYLDQVNFRPLPTKVADNSYNQILAIK